MVTKEEKIKWRSEGRVGKGMEEGYIVKREQGGQKRRKKKKGD